MSEDEAKIENLSPFNQEIKAGNSAAASLSDGRVLGLTRPIKILGQVSPSPSTLLLYLQFKLAQLS